VEEDPGDDGILNWLGNEAADAAAKGLAKQAWQEREAAVKTQEDERRRLQALAERAAICVRIAQRDSDSWGHKRAPRKRKAWKAGGGQCGDHVLVPRPAGVGFWCDRCHLVAATASSRKSLAGRPCRGDVTARIHESHSLRFSSGVMWCRTCGSYTSRLPRALVRPCPARPPSVAARNVLRRLREGLPPTTAPYLRRQGEEWDQEQTDAWIALRQAELDTNAAAADAAATNGCGANARRRRPPAASGTVPRRADASPFDVSGTSQVGAERAGDAADDAAPHLTSMQIDARVESWRICAPAPLQAWTRRLSVAASWARGRCHLCEAVANARCKGCDELLCVRCARQRRHCVRP
jgi:hypothetical protein